MEGFMTTVNNMVLAALPYLEWLLFFVLLFALIGIGMRFYSFFNNNNYTYYQPTQKNIFVKEPVSANLKKADASKSAKSGTIKKRKAVPKKSKKKRT